jgi:predicted Zn finger-like uncharacterized protein
MLRKPVDRKIPLLGPTMPIHIACPSCHTPFSVSDQARGKTIRCTRCQKTFVAAEKPLAPVEHRLQDKPRQASVPPPTTPVKADVMPPHSPRKKTSALLLGGVIGLLVLVVGGAGAFWLLSTKTDAPPANEAAKPEPDQEAKPDESPEPESPSTGAVGGDEVLLTSSPAETLSKVKDGFKALFNGVNLDAWGPLNGPLETWSIKDGTIVTEGKPRGWLLTNREYGDFELLLEYRLGPKAVSGVAVRTPSQGAPYTQGIKIPLVDDSADPKLAAVDATGALAGVVGPKKKAAKPIGEWNELRIVARGRTVKVEINGVEVVSENLDSHKALFQKFPGLQRPRGRLGVQSYSGSAEFRNIWLKDLTPGPRPTLVLETGGHTARVGALFFTPDGQQLITTSADGTIRFWDVQTGELKRILRGVFALGYQKAALSPDGKTLAVPSGIGHILFIDIESGNIRVLKPELPGWVLGLAFAPSGEQLAIGSHKETVVVDVKSGKRIWNAKGGGSFLVFSPDGNSLAMESGGGMCVQDMKTGKQAAIAYMGSPIGWTPDGKTLMCSHVGGVIFLNPSKWERGKWEKIYVLGPTHALAYLPGNNEIVTVGRLNLDPFSGARVNIIDARTGKPKLTFPDPAPLPPDPEHLAVSHDGKYIATSNGPSNATIIWQRDGKRLHILRGEGSPPFSAGWSKDGKAIAWGHKLNINGDYLSRRPLAAALDLSELQFLVKPDLKDFRRAVLKLDGATLIPNHHEAGRMVRDGKNYDCRVWENNESHGGTLMPNERLIIAGNTGLYLYDTKIHEPYNKDLNRFFINVPAVQAFSWLPDDIWDVAPSPDNKYILTASRDQILRVWTVQPKRLDVLLSLFVAGKEWIVWTPQGYYAASPGGERLMGWVIDNGVNKLSTFHPASRFRASLFRPDVIKLVLKEGNVGKALKAADAVRGQANKPTDVTQVLPPEVSVKTSAGPGAAVKDGKLRIDAEASPVGAQPIMALQLLIDDRPYTGAKGLISFDKPQAGPVKGSWEVDLPAGPHRIRVLARTTASLGTSRGMAVLAEADTPNPKKEKPSLYVLAVGIDAYADKGLTLGGAVNDAVKLEKVFQDYSSPLFGKIEPKLVVNKDATRQGMLEGLDWLKKSMTGNDTAVFFYAGHGGLEKGEFYLLPQDVDQKNLAKTGVSRAEIKKRMQGLPGRVVVLLDACHSGAIGLLFDDLSRELIDEDCGVVVMCAATPSKAALETGGHGLFTLSVIEGLSGKASKRDGSVYLHHLQQYVVDHVMDLSKDTQHPIVVVPPWMRPFGLSKPEASPGQ